MKTKVEKFPEKNPNPVLSIEKTGTVLYSNKAGEPLLREWGVRVGEELPSDLADFAQRVFSRKTPEKMEVRVAQRDYLIIFHPFPEEEYVNVYGFDISDQKELEGKSRVKERQNAVLHMIGKIALGQENLQTFMDESVKLIANNLELEYCKIMELLPDGRFLLRAGIGWKPEFVGKQVVGGEKESQAGFTLLSRMPVIVEDFEVENRFEKPEILEIHRIASGASVVIGSLEKVFGVLVVNSTKKRKFTSEELSIKLKEKSLEKAPTGINGLDDITYGGLPKGRPTLVCGSAGSGKTLMAMEFLVKGAEKYDEPGVFVAFEESSEELSENFASLGFDLNRLEAENKLAVDYIKIDSSEIVETGEYDLEGLFIRLGMAIDSISAKRVALDTLEVLFSGFRNEAILRSELRRLFRWLKGKGVTTIVTGERGENSLTRYGLEEYVADCVILLDNRMMEQIATRRLRIIKYRGSRHGTNEYPFMIEKDGISVLPITSLGLKHESSSERISTGIKRLDAMFDGRGYYRGSTILISGTAGTGKTSFAAEFAKAACERGERCLYFAFEESPSQIIRNMKSIGIDFQPCIDTGLVQINASRPMAFGLEMHLIAMIRLIDRFDPTIVIIDPISNLINVGIQTDVQFMLTRLIDHLKLKNITAVCTSLVEHESTEGMTGQGISSLMDTWIHLRFFGNNSSERNRGVSIIKSRGMEHSNQIREYLMTVHGIEIQDVYLGPSGGLLMGSARAAQEAKELADITAQNQNLSRRKRELESMLKSLDAQIAVLRSEFEVQEEELNKLTYEDEQKNRTRSKERDEMAKLRRADAPA